jgi:diguanylate cyclase (GGDEF)-like protein
VADEISNSFNSGDVMDNKSTFSFKWYDGLQFKMAAIFVVLFFFIALSVFMILKTFGDQLIQEEAYLRLNEANNQVISELERHTVLSATLVDTMANLAEALPNTNASYHSLVPPLLNYKGTEAFIGGGGIWPAPYQFDEKKERNSFFWARNQFGQLSFYDDYNKLQGNGYHQEEWYLPATHLLEGETYWSKSYTDPYSLQPMVTVSAPLIKDKKNIGVATIDLKLQGLQQLLKEATRSFRGYAFAIDRNGTFLSYPKIQQVITTVKNRDGSELQSFINYKDLAKKHSQFEIFSNILDSQRNDLLENLLHNSQFGKKLADTMALASYQINKQEANLIVASLLNSRNDSNNALPKRSNLFLDNDPILNEPVFVSISIMPDTYWKIITVMPYSVGIEKITATYEHLMLSTLTALIITIFIIWLFIRYIVTSPISHLAKQVQTQVDNNNSSEDMALLNTSGRGELNSLVNIFNQRTGQLLSSKKEIEKLAHFDILTGLPNRRLLLNRLNEKLAMCDRQQSYGALLFIDLDNFKRINDSLGHAMGDELLLRVSERFADCIRTEDTVARLGGDEFVVLIIKNQDYSRKLNHESTLVAQKLVNAMKAPIILKDRLHHMTISVGITVFASHKSNSDELLRQADTAMYRAKDKGKNCFCFFNTEMQEQAHKRVDIEEALRVALINKELFLVYQPQVDNKGHCFAVEALIRWKHPVKGLLSPIEFISIAEESGLIIEIGTWVLEESCAQFKRWSEENIYLDKISVNVSPKQFRHINFVNTIREALEKHHLSANQLTLEITEGIVIEDIKDTINKMTILKSLGVGLSIDDFGTGYSSLKYLKELPLSQLKIDQSFVCDIVSDPKNTMIVKTIISMAKHLDLNVIAEGVENREQMELLIEKGCEQFQGYYFSQPKTEEAFKEYINSHLIKNVRQINNLGAS